MLLDRVLELATFAVCIALRSLPLPRGRIMVAYEPGPGPRAPSRCLVTAQCCRREVLKEWLKA